MHDTRDTNPISFFVALLPIITITLLGACGKESKTGATDATASSGKSSIPNNVGDYSGGTNGLPTGSISDISSPEAKEAIDGALGAGSANNLLSALMGLESPSSLQATSNALASALPLLQRFSQMMDQQTKQELVSLLNFMAKELQDLKKNFTIAKVKAFAKKIRGFIAGIIKGALARRGNMG